MLDRWCIYAITIRINSKETKCRGWLEISSFSEKLLKVFKKRNYSGVWLAFQGRSFCALIWQFFLVIHISSCSGVEDTLRCIGFYKKEIAFCINTWIYMYIGISLYTYVYIYLCVYIYIYVTDIYVEYTVHIHPLLNLYRLYINIKWPHLFACVCPRKGGLIVFGCLQLLPWRMQFHLSFIFPHLDCIRINCNASKFSLKFHFVLFLYILK